MRRPALLFCLLPMLAPAVALSHEDDDIAKKPPTKAAKELASARKKLDAAKAAISAEGKLACCIKPAKGVKSDGCDRCITERGYCSCAANLASGKGVCGECLGGWRGGRGLFPGIQASSVTLLPSTDWSPAIEPAEPAKGLLAEYRSILLGAKKTLVTEGRFACCVGKGGCDECAFEASCACSRKAANPKSKGVCSQCFEGLHAGHGRIDGMDLASVRLDPGGHDEMQAFAGIPMQREGSGTSWLPDASPMEGAHSAAGNGWSRMLHYRLGIAYDHQSGPRGDEQFNSLNWGMAMLRRTTASDDLTLRGMLSLEPLTVGSRGYPLLLQTGERYGGSPLLDRQHPHDLVMEAAARYRRQTGPKTSVMIYGGPAAEPALGPPAYMHRPSSLGNPLAPIGHHWQDGSHVTFGAATLGVAHGPLQLEGSAFTGREPDEHRWNFDRIRLDSASSRLSWNPGRQWALQASYGSLNNPESHSPAEHLNRSSLSALYSTNLGNGTAIHAGLVWGRNRSEGRATDSWLIEAAHVSRRGDTLFGRFEWVDKLGSEIRAGPGDARNSLRQLTLGGLRELNPGGKTSVGVGAAVTFNRVPSALRSTYGSSPKGLWLFLRIAPGKE